MSPGHSIHELLHGASQEDETGITRRVDDLSTYIEDCALDEFITK